MLVDNDEPKLAIFSLIYLQYKAPTGAAPRAQPDGVVSMMRAVAFFMTMLGMGAGADEQRRQQGKNIGL